MTSVPVIPSEVDTHDNTMFADWHRCRYKYYINHVRGLQRKTKSTALMYGGLIHAGLATWYRTKDAKKVVDTMEEEPYEDPIDDFRTRDRGIRKVLEYIEYEVDSGLEWNVVINENAFELEDSEGFRYGGKMDLLIERHEGFWVVDHKTTTRREDSWASQFTRHPQPVGYCWAGRELSNEHIKGFIINRIVTHKNPKPAVQQITRFPYLVSEEDIREWRSARIKDYHAIAQAHEANHFPRNRYACVTKYGKCPLFELCNVPESSRERVLEEDFVYDPWDWMKGEDE